MKILVINNNAMFEYNGGLCIYQNTGQFIVGLNELGANVENFHFREKVPKNYYMATFDLLKWGIRITAIKKSRFKILAYLKAYIIGIRRLLHNDFPYIFYPNSFSYLALICILLKKPYGIYIRGKEGIDSRISRYIFKNASIVLTVSPAFTNKVKALGGNSETIRPMIDYSSSDIVRNRSYQNKEKYQLLFLSRVEYPKGIADLIQALEILVKQGIQDFYLTIVGNGPDYEAIQVMIQQLNLKKYVNLVGLVTENEKIRKYYLDSDIFISPSHHEGFPRVLYEAMIFGTPIITTMVGSISYLMKDNYNCISIETRDPEGIAQKLHSVITNYSAIGDLANNATLTIDNYLSQTKETHSEQLFRNVKEELTSE